MKKIAVIMIGLFLSFSAPVLSQVRILNDPAIVGQEKRNVYELWGEFAPYPNSERLFKWFGGRVNTNFTASAVWGYHYRGIPFNFNVEYIAPTRRNRRYREGEDIRPLRAGGEETLRLAMADVMKEEAVALKKSIDSVERRARADFAHWSHLIISADPLYLLYYKKMLEPLSRFSDNPRSYRDWGFDSYEIYAQAQSTGQITQLQEKLDVLKEKLKKAKTIDMPRGKRFLMFHEALMGWRALQASISQVNSGNGAYLRMLNKSRALSRGTDFSGVHRTDKEIAQEIVNRFKDKF